MSEKQFEGKSAIVTGGSRGIGRAIVKELAGRGAKVAFSYTKSQETANALMKVGRIVPVELSPNWLVMDQPKPPEKRGMPIWAKIGAVCGLGIAAIIYLIMFFASSSFVQSTIEALRL